MESLLWIKTEGSMTLFLQSVILCHQPPSLWGVKHIHSRDWEFLSYLTSSRGSCRISILLTPSLLLLHSFCHNQQQRQRKHFSVQDDHEEEEGVMKMEEGRSYSIWLLGELMFSEKGSHRGGISSVFCWWMSCLLRFIWENWQIDNSIPENRSESHYCTFSLCS